MEGKEYEERACCEVGTTVPSDVCPDETAVKPAAAEEGGSSNTGMIVGIVVGVVFVIVALLAVIVCRKKKPSQQHASTINEHVPVMPPPTAPGFVETGK